MCFSLNHCAGIHVSHCRRKITRSLRPAGTHCVALRFDSFGHSLGVCVCVSACETENSCVRIDVEVLCLPLNGLLYCLSFADRHCHGLAWHREANLRGQNGRKGLKQEGSVLVLSLFAPGASCRSNRGVRLSRHTGTCVRKRQTSLGYIKLLQNNWAKAQHPPQTQGHSVWRERGLKTD